MRVKNFLPADRTAFLRGDSYDRSSGALPSCHANGSRRIKRDYPRSGPFPRYAHPHDPAVGPDGSLWFSGQMVNKLGRLDPKTGEFREYPLVEGKNSGPHGLLADHGGNLWFTANFGGYIGKLDPRKGKITQYPMPSEKGDDPHTAVFDANGMLWFTLQGGNMVGRLDPKTGKKFPRRARCPMAFRLIPKMSRFSANLAPTRCHPLT